MKRKRTSWRNEFQDAGIKYWDSDDPDHVFRKNKKRKKNTKQSPPPFTAFIDKERPTINEEELINWTQCFWSKKYSPSQLIYLKELLILYVHLFS